jgi:dihydropyrimidinase
MLDLLIKGGTVVSPKSSIVADVGIKDGKVVLLASSGAPKAEAHRTIAAQGKYVVPGGIDAHVHFNLKVSEAMQAQSAKFGSRAAAFGGTTTFIDFAFQVGSGSLVRAIEDKVAELNSDKPDVDFALHTFMTGDISFEAMEEIPEAIQGGVSSFKMFTTFSAGSAVGGLFTDDGRIWGVMQQTARHGGMAMVHCEDNCVIDFNVRRLYREGRQQAPNIHEARPTLAEEAAMARVMLLAKRSGSPLYIVHVSSSDGVNLISEARGKNLPVFGESLHNYLAFTQDDYRKPNGMTYHNYPALKTQADRAVLWQALRDGVLQTTASDDLTIPLAAKLSGHEVDNVPGGHNGVETRMAYMWSEGVAKGLISAERFVDVNSTSPARVFGLYPRKGIIAPGSDADIVIMDPDVKRTIRLAELHSKCDYSLWDGLECHGWPVLTMVRGNVLVENDKWVGKEGTGQYVRSGSPMDV